jgi:hypothetical protein
MSRRAAIVLAWALALAAALSDAQQGPPLPAAPIEPRVRTACVECHDASIVMQQRLDKKTWGKEVDKMVRWGATVKPDERDAFVEYLSSNFPPDKVAYVPPKPRKK